MARVNVEVEDEHAMLRLQQLARKNGLKTTKPHIINMCLTIVDDMTKKLKPESFEKVTGLEK